MAGAFGQDIRTPLVIEASGPLAVAAGIGQATTVVEEVASLHATQITVMLDCTVALQSVSLVLYARSKTIAVTVQISAAIPANTPTVLRYGLGTNNGIGQVYDVVVTNGEAAAGQVKLWTAARS